LAGKPGLANSQFSSSLDYSEEVREVIEKIFTVNGSLFREVIVDGEEIVDAEALP